VLVVSHFGTFRSRIEASTIYLQESDNFNLGLLRAASVERSKGIFPIFKDTKT